MLITIFNIIYINSKLILKINIFNFYKNNYNKNIYNKNIYRYLLKNNISRFIKIYYFNKNIN